MASTAAPGTPEHTTPRRTATTRSLTGPSRLAQTPRAAPDPEIGAAQGIETLYVHPRANIVKFTTAGLSRSRPGSPRGKPNDGAAGSWPWSSTTESTLAAGPMEIYRVPGSVSFLHSGALLHAILPRSQCWCVDGVSKFALRVLPDTYYRIELPGEAAEELEMVEALKGTLREVLFYERTPCPFARGFTVELPEERVEVKKGRRRSSGPAKRWTLNRPYSWRPEGHEEIGEERERERESGEEVSGEEEQMDSAEHSHDEAAGADGRQDSANERADDVHETPSKIAPRDFGSMRSITAPPHLSHQPSPQQSVRARAQMDGRSAETTEEDRFNAAAADAQGLRSTRTYQAIPTDMPPSPPESSAGAELHNLEAAREAPAGDTGTETADSTTEDESQDESQDMSQTISQTISQVRAQDESYDESQDESQDKSQDESRGGSEVEPQGESEDELQGESRGELYESHDESQDESKDSPSHDNVVPTEIPSSQPLAHPRAVLNLPACEQEAQSKRESAYPSPEPYGSDSLTHGLAAPHVPKHKPTSTTQPHTPTSPKPAQQDSSPTRPNHSMRNRSPSPADPYAAIQARILARRSIGSPNPSPASTPRTPKPGPAALKPQPSRANLSSFSHSYSSAAQGSSSSLPVALVNKACTLFLGPPAHLVALMLRIAARFANGTFGEVFFVASPEGAGRRVPGSFVVDEDDGERAGDEWAGDGEGVGEEDEDDFGVPLRSPVRFAAVREREGRSEHRCLEGA